METIEDEHGNLTTVYTTVNIEDVKVGDLVYSYNTLTGEVGLREVTATSSNTSNHINYLTIADENGHEQTIETTDGHPFWVVTDGPDLSRAARDYVFENDVWLFHDDVTPTEFGYWVEAKDLRVGDVFLGANGELSTLTNAVRVEQEGGIGIFNFTVEGNHNYFILAKDFNYGQSCVLVHNNSPRPERMKPGMRAWDEGEGFNPPKKMSGLDKADLGKARAALDSNKEFSDFFHKKIQEGHKAGGYDVSNPDVPDAILLEIWREWPGGQ